jgi:hypothetical protein
MSKNDILRAMDYLGHIVEAIDRIHRYVDDLTEPGFLDDEKRRMPWCGILKSWARPRTTSKAITPRLPKPMLMCPGL